MLRVTDLHQHLFLHQPVDRSLSEVFRPAEQFGHIAELRRADGGEIQFEQFRPRLGFADRARLFGQVGEMPRDNFVNVRIAPRARFGNADGQYLKIGLQLLQSLVEFGFLGVGEFGETAQVNGIQRAFFKQGFVDLLRGLREASLLVRDEIIFFGRTIIFGQRVKIRRGRQRDEGGFAAQDFAVIPDLFIERAVLPAPGDVTGIVVLVRDGTLARDGCPQRGQVNALDRPEVDEAARFHEAQGLRRSQKRFGRRQVEGAGAMRVESF